MSGRKNRWSKLSELEKSSARLGRWLNFRNRVRIDAYPESAADFTWEYRGCVCSVVRNRMFDDSLKVMASFREKLPFAYNMFEKQHGNLNGYARFPKRPLYDRGYHGIATYIPVPGGMTYAQQYVDGTFVYGYDTAHIDMEAVKYKDGFWHRMQVEFMVDAIIIARRLEKRYRRAQTNARKATVLDELNRRLYLRSVQVGRGKQGIEIMGNTGVMLKLLAGDL